MSRLITEMILYYKDHLLTHNSMIKLMSRKNSRSNASLPLQSLRCSCQRNFMNNLVFHAYVPLKVKLGRHKSVSAVITIYNKCVKVKCLLKGRGNAESSCSVFLLWDMICGCWGSIRAILHDVHFNLITCVIRSNPRQVCISRQGASQWSYWSSESVACSRVLFLIWCTICSLLFFYCIHQ